MFDLEWGVKVQFLSVELIGLYSTIITSETIILGGGGDTSVYVRLSHRIQKGQDIGGQRRT